LPDLFKSCLEDFFAQYFALWLNFPAKLSRKHGDTLATLTSMVQTVYCTQPTFNSSSSDLFTALNGHKCVEIFRKSLLNWVAIREESMKLLDTLFRD
jgi:hypothetical protein